MPRRVNLVVSFVGYSGCSGSHIVRCWTIFIIFGSLPLSVVKRLLYAGGVIKAQA